MISSYARPSAASRTRIKVDPGGNPPAPTSSCLTRWFQTGDPAGSSTGPSFDLRSFSSSVSDAGGGRSGTFGTCGVVVLPFSVEGREEGRHSSALPGLFVDQQTLPATERNHVFQQSATNDRLSSGTSAGPFDLLRLKLVAIFSVSHSAKTSGGGSPIKIHVFFFFTHKHTHKTHTHTPSKLLLPPCGI